jgi:hypothetical protein
VIAPLPRLLHPRQRADANSFFSIGSLSSGTLLTATNAFRVSANAPAERFAVSTSNTLLAQST